MTNRRTFLAGASAFAGAFTLGGGAFAQVMPPPKKFASGRRAEGVFPIGWSVCTPDNKLDKAGMVKQQEFLNRAKVAGIAWPQNASQWQALSDQEWADGVDAITSVKGQTAVAIGVQTVGFVTAKSVERVQEAKRKGADAVVSLCDNNAAWPDVIAYFQTLAKGGLPIIMQCTGNITLDQMVQLAQAVPQIIAVKDEAQGNVAARAPEMIRRTGGKLSDWSGGGGNQMLPEMANGMRGTCHYVGMSDVQQHVYDLFMAGKRDEATAAFEAYRKFMALPHANDYVLTARGVLPESAIYKKAAPRAAPAAGAAPAGGGGGRGGRGGAAAGGGGGRAAAAPITDADKATIRAALASPDLKKYLQA
jgi:dihydrodipicolinate synthase/N-acetylneuraminate lyase